MNIDTALFNVKDCVIAGDECILVTPKEQGVEWTDDNKIFRSSIWRKSDMYPVSLGFKKFTNLGEKPLFEPIEHYTDLEFVRKIDGSLLIVSQYKGELIVRTRGTIDASNLANGYEINLLKEKYPKVFNNMWLQSESHTLLFEWTTPTNRIVLQETEKPSLWLIGIVSHKEEVMDPHKWYNNIPLKTPYHYFTQFELDQQASYLNVLRPERYKLTLENISDYLKDKDTIEGIVICANDGQLFKKVKTPRYLYMHKVYTGIKHLNQVIDLWVEYGALEREAFEALLASKFDWELVVSLKSNIDELFNKWETIQNKLTQLRQFIDEHRSLPRKEIAQLIMNVCKCSGWKGIAFEILDNKRHKIDKLFTLD